VAAWLAAPETRLALLRPEAHAAGVGATEVGAPLVVTLTADPRALAASRLTNAEVVAFPTVAAGDAPARTVGADGVPRGPVITLSVFGGVISVERVAVTRARDGAVVAATWRTFASDQGVDPRDVIIVPDAPLRAGERYDVRVEGALGGAPLVHAWRFDTAPAELRVAGGPRG
ncbi:MAG: hypothetical protein KC635_30200, partial [Myxococcales bacterium]|nr:hypothetical protein [Myxococcales bacterium]